MTKDVKVLETVGFLPVAVVLVVLTLMSLGTAAAQEPTHVGTSARSESTKSAATVASRRSIRDIVSQLRRFPDESRSETDVPPAVSRNLTELKHALRDLIVEVAGAPNATVTEPDALAALVIERLEREDVPVGDLGGYGAIPAIRFRRPPEYPSWLVVTTTLGLANPQCQMIAYGPSPFGKDGSGTTARNTLQCCAKRLSRSNCLFRNRPPRIFQMTFEMDRTGPQPHFFPPRDRRASSA